MNGEAEPRSETTPVSKLSPGQQFDILKAWLRADMEHERDWHGEARDAFAFRAGEQWTPEDRALLSSQQRPHIVFNRVLTILKAVAGMEINGRHEIHFIPRGTQDTAINEVLSAASKWMADGCDGEDEESQAFDHCCTCGMGFVEERMSYEDDAQGLYVEEAIDPREMYWDRTAKKKNIADARRMARARKMPLSDAVALFPGKTREQLDAVWAEEGLGDYPTKTLEEKRRRDSDNMSNLPYDDQCEVTIVEIQWFEREIYWIVADVQTNSKAELTDEQYRVFEQRMKLLNMDVHAARMSRKVYKSAFLGAEMLQKAGPAPIKGQFRWKCVTGEYDAVKGTWFGLIKVMRDPQMWANKWLSQILHILNTTAKGGILAETSAFDNQREAEDGYGRPDTITWLADGALSGDKPKLMEKPGKGMTDGYLGLMTFAISSIKDVTGINLELLGQQDQNQPGILEAMRKQAGMTVLATLFDSLRRFRKQIGRTRLFFIQNYLSDGRLIRVAGPDSVQAVALAKDRTAGEYDVIVDDTPTSPNQKEANWAIIQPLLGVFKDQLMANPKVFAMLLEYSPLPSRIVEAIKAFVDQAQNDPQAQQDAALKKKLVIDAAVASISKDQSIAEMNNAKAGSTQATAMYDIAMARNLLAKNDLDGLANHMKMYELAQSAQKTSAEVDHTNAKTAREIVGAHTDVVKANTEQAKATSAHHDAIVGRLIDHLSARAGAHRDIAAARKDHVAADHQARTPIPTPGQ
jgi:hypothetical protein